MDAGRLNRRVRIEQKSVARDASYGSEVVSWVTLATVWAEVEDLIEVAAHGGEAVAQQQRVLTRQAKVCIRYRGDVTSKMRVIVIARNRTLQIVSLAEVGQRDELQLMCEEYSSG